MNGINTVANIPRRSISNGLPNTEKTNGTDSQIAGSVEPKTYQSKDRSMSDRATSPTEEQLFALIKEGRARADLDNGKAAGPAPNKKQDISCAINNTREAASTATIATLSQHHTTTASQQQGPKAASTPTQMKTPRQRITLQEYRKHKSTPLLPPPSQKNVAPCSPELPFLPDKIVLLIDKQDSYLKSFSHPNVIYIFDTKLNFRNAFDMIMKTSYFFKNTLFVVLCGTMSALRQDINENCHLFQCKEPLYNYAMQEFKVRSLKEHLINEAKTLRTLITTMENCDVIFSGVLPVRLDQAEVYEAARHYSQTGHQTRVNKSKCEALYDELCAGLKGFNSWAKEDAELRGFPNWSLVDMFTAATTIATENSNKLFIDLTENGNSAKDSSSHPPSKHLTKNVNSSCLVKGNSNAIKNGSTVSQGSENPTDRISTSSSPTQPRTRHLHFTHPTQADGVTLTGECMVKRRHALKTKLKETFLRIKRITQTLKLPSAPAAAAAADNKDNSKVPGVKPKPESSLQGAPGVSVSKTPVVVLCDSTYEKVLSRALSHWITYRKVTLIIQKNLISSSIDDIMHNHYSEVSANTQARWILCFGISDFVDITPNPQCLEQQCRMCLECLSVQNKNACQNIGNKVQEAISKVMKLKNELLWVMPDTMMAMAPPMQVAVLHGEVFKDHAKLHSAASKHNLFISSRATYTFMEKFYSQLFGAWLYTFIQQEGGTLVKGLVDHITNYKHKSIKLLDERLACVNKFGKEWPMMVDSLITTSLTLGVHRSEFLSSVARANRFELSPSIGKMLTFDLPQKPGKVERLFQQVVVIGNQMPAELELLCYKLSIHIVPERVTFDEAGKSLILKYQELWPKGTLWLILSDVLHLATLKTLPACGKAKCEQHLNVYDLDIPNAKGRRQNPIKVNAQNKYKWVSFAEHKITNVISTAKAFCESLMDALGDGSAVCLPPVTPVLLRHMYAESEHAALHMNYGTYWSVPIAVGNMASWNKSYTLMKKAWLEMVKPYLKSYPMLVKILDLYREPNQDWIRNLGNFLVSFATATMDGADADAVFSDAEFSSGEEDVMEELKEETEDFGASALLQHPRTLAAFPACPQHLSTPPAAHTPEGAQSSTPATFSRTIHLSSTPVRKDVHGDHGIPTARVTGNTKERAPQRTLLRTPKDSPGIPVRVPERTLIKTPLVKTRVQQQQQQQQQQSIAPLAKVTRTVLGPQQYVKERIQRIPVIGKGQESLSRDGIQSTQREVNGQPASKTAAGTPRRGNNQVGRHNSTTIRSPCVVRTEKGQEPPKKNNVQQTCRAEKSQVAVKMPESHSKVKSQSLSRTEKDKGSTRREQSQDDAVEEGQVRMDSDQELQMRFTENGDAEMSDDENNGSWIILSETEESHNDSLREEEEEPDDPSLKDSSKKDSLSNSEQEIVSEKRESSNDHSMETPITLGAPAKQQPLLPEAKDSLSNSEQEMVSERRESCSDHSKDTTILSGTPPVRESLVTETDALCNHSEDTMSSIPPAGRHSVVLKAKGLLNKDSKDDNTASALGKHNSDTTTTTILNQHTKHCKAASTPVPCPHESHTKYGKDDNVCKVLTEQNVLTDPDHVENSQDTDLLSNSDSTETIPLCDSELGSRNLDVCDEYSATKCDPASEMLKKDSAGAQNLGVCGMDNVNMEGESVVGGGEGCPLRRKRKFSSTDGSSPTFCSASFSSSFDADSETKKLFTILEDNLNEEYQLKWQTYQQVPEVHPDFGDKRTEFLRLYKESKEGKGPADPEHCERRWRVFWADTLKKQLYDEWESGKKLLVERFRAILRSRCGEGSRNSTNEESPIRSSREGQPKRLKLDEGRKENCAFESNLANKKVQSSPVVFRKENSPKSLLQSSNAYQKSPTSLSVTQENSNTLIQISPSDGEKEKSLPSSQNAAENKQNATLHSQGSSLTELAHCKQTILKVSKTTPDNETVLHKDGSASTGTFMEDKTQRRVCLILNTFAMLTELGRSLGALASAVVPIVKKVLDKGVHSNEAVRLLADKDNALVMKLCSEKLRHLGEKAKGAYREKLLQCSSDTTELIDDVSSCLKKMEAIENLDILSIAKATAWQDTPYVLNFIKSTLARKGVDDPSENTLNKLFMAVSSHHFNMAVQNSPAAAASTLPDPNK